MNKVLKMLLAVVCIIAAFSTMLFTAGCGAVAENTQDEVELDSGVEQVTFYHYPAEKKEGEVIEIGQVAQEISSFGFMGWRAESVNQRGRLCADVIAAEGDQICMLPASTNVRYYVDPTTFSVANYNELRFQALLHSDALNTYLPSLGWTYGQGTAAAYTVKIVGGTVNAAAYTDTADVRRWVSVSCDSSSGNLDEPIPLVGKWKRCGAITVTIDVVGMLSDGCTGCRQVRLRQGAGVAVAVWGSGLGIGNIDPHTVFQRTQTMGEWLSVEPSDRNACALDLYALGAKTEIRKLASSACDGWEWH